MTDHGAGEPNRLIHETSPYLLQHAYNPVDWYAWGPEALERAAAEDKPILLSVGYSACHWCHVMAHDSFENPETAELMNELFINIKVDREERPDIDAIYMDAVQAMTGHGGWPMTVFLTPDGKPFYGGTYYPPAPRYNMPGFPQLLMAIAGAWRERRHELLSAGERTAEALNRTALLQPSDSPLDVVLLDKAAQALVKSHDRHEGGFGGAPKFPQPMNLDFLLQRYVHSGDPALLHVVNITLTKMAQGGIYDQLGGGFHRYSTDDVWLVPHFEKMLYDNAQLARTYLHAWQVTGDPLFRRIVEETLDYVMREMTSPEGAFYSTQDADSEGQEGKFFLWTPGEIKALLGEEDARLFSGYFDVTGRGNFREGGAGANILHVRRDLHTVAADLEVSEKRLEEAIARGRRVLFGARERRVRPNRDEKVLTSWNGLMLAAFSEAARALDRDDYRLVAERNAGFLLRELRRENGRLLRTWKRRPEQGEGAGEAKLNGFLEDYACVIEGLLELYQTTFDPHWFVAARELAGKMLAHFQASGGGFFDTSDDHDALITRPRGLQDNATPSGNAMATAVLLKLAGLTNELHYVETAHEALAQVAAMMAQYPMGFGQWLQALSYALSQPKEIAIIGNPEAADTQALLAVVRSGYRPNQVVALGAPDPEGAQVPLLRDRRLVDGQAACYVCRALVCQVPVTEPERLRTLLERSVGLDPKGFEKP